MHDNYDSNLITINKEKFLLIMRKNPENYKNCKNLGIKYWSF